MRRFTLCALLVLAAGLLAAPAFAAKFTIVGAEVTDGIIREGSRDAFHGGLLATFIEVGAGGNELTRYKVTADCTAVYACINNGGNTPKSETKQGVAGPVIAEATFTATKNGKVSGAIPVAPIGPGSILCTPGLILELAEVSYTNVVITDLTHGVTVSIPGTFSLVIIPTN